MCGEGERPHAASLHSCGAVRGIAAPGLCVYFTLSRRSPLQKITTVISLLHTLAISGQTFPSECRVLELEEIAGSVLCPHHTGGETESSLFKSFA